MHPRHIIALFFLLLLALAPQLPARAQSDPAPATRVELLDGGWRDGKRLAAVVMRLAPGWKTYWRVPGEGGLPPRFDFSGSANVDKVRVLWPAPKRFRSPVTGETIGFKRLVVFPLLITPKNRDEPMRLTLKLDYGVCGEMCMPATANVSLLLPPEPEVEQATRALIDEWLRKTPLVDDGALKLAAVRLVREGDRPALEVALTGTGADAVSDMFVEGVDMAVFGPPRRIGEKNGAVVYRLRESGGLVSEEDFAHARLRLTILRNDKAIERTVALP